MQEEKSASMAGLGTILEHNKTVQPNDELLNRLKLSIPQFFDKDGNFKADKFEGELKKNNIAESRDGYKLGFVGKDYARLQVGLVSETMIVPDCKHNSLSGNAKSGNIFITGDNLDALRHLVNAYENKIKLIYIDPPYNTGKEFVYSDKFEFSDEKLKSALGYSDEEITRLKSIQGKSSHSAWLTFMYPRLKIAQRLLKDDGVIFVSIDDNEQANLKLLMDDVFGEGNFVIDFIRKTKSMTGDEGSGVNIQHENVICYTKTNVFLQGEEKRFDGYKNPDNDPKGEWTSGDPSAKSGGDTTYFPIKNPFTGREDFPPKGRFWAFSTETRDNYIATGKIKFKENYKSGERGFIFKRYKNELNTNFNPTNSLDLTGNEYMNSVGTKEIYDLLAGNHFDNPKPLSLIKKLISFYYDKNALILDFFAGSATTAHAVMQLNAEDGGNRKFIVVQLDEKTNPNSEARQAGYNTIDEIARDRIFKAGKKILADYESNPEKQNKGWDKDIGFKHYRLITPEIKTIDQIIEFNPEESTLIADDMIKPFEYSETKTSGLDTLITTWLIDDGFRFDTDVEEIVFGTYKAHYVREAATLYLVNREWNTTALKDLLNQIGKNKLLVGTIVVYPYSFEFEAMRELKTNIKNNLDNPPNLIERY